MRKTIVATFVLGVVCSLMFTVNNAGCFAEEGPAAYWSMDEGQGDVIKDKSGNNNHGKIHGAVWVEGKSGKALKFDGIDDYVDCGSKTSLNITDAITIEAWVKCNIDGSWNGIVWKQGVFQFYGFNAANGLSWSMDVHDSEDDRMYTAVSSSGHNGIWVHLAGTFDSSTHRNKFYVNGELKDDDYNADVGSLNISSNNLLIGRRMEAGSFFNGIIDEVKIYNRVLSQEEIEKTILETSHERIVSMKPFMEKPVAALFDGAKALQIAEAIWESSQSKKAVKLEI